MVARCWLRLGAARRRGHADVALLRSYRVPELGVLVVGVTSWSGEGVEPKSQEMVFDPLKV
jgi:hypothetical protein